MTDEEHALWNRVNALEFIVQNLLSYSMRGPDFKARLTTLKQELTAQQNPIRLAQEIPDDELDRWQSAIRKEIARFFDDMIVRAR